MSRTADRPLHTPLGWPRAMRLAGMVLAAAVAFPAHAAEPAAGPRSATSCVAVPILPPHPDERHVVVLATATADTVPAGWGDVRMDPGWRRPRGWRRKPVLGQMAHVSAVGGPAAAGMPAGPAVLVPWDPGCGDARWPWAGGFAWLRAGEPDAIVGRLRNPEHWVGGIPTIDVFRPDLMRASGILAGAVRWKSTAAERFGFYSTVPPADRIRAEAWGALTEMRAWLAANAAAAQDHPIHYAARGMHADAANAEVRARPSPLAGTYRFQVSRTGGPTHTFYVRTPLTPARALFPRYDTAAPPFPGAAEGYEFTLLAARERHSALPSSRPGPLARAWRRLTGIPDGPSMEIRLPAIREPDGSHRFRGHLELLNISYGFRGDPELPDWIYDWFKRRARTLDDQPTADIVLRPDGGVEWSQVMELAPDRVITIRGERISDVTWEWDRRDR